MAEYLVVPVAIDTRMPEQRQTRRASDLQNIINDHLAQGWIVDAITSTAIYLVQESEPAPDIEPPVTIR